MKKLIKKMFPWLVRLKDQQRVKAFYKKMESDGNTYSKTLLEEDFKNVLFEDKFFMINENTGMDIIYQENKVFNLKLVGKTINNIVIQPGEVFSFWQLARYANKDEDYKDGLVVVDGVLTTAPAGGLCHISNLLCWIFLHSPLTFIERTGHRSREFPNPPDMLTGIDATIMEGITDLKVKNNTNEIFQIQIDFDDEYMIGRILSKDKIQKTYKIKNQNLKYYEVDGEVYEEIDIVREIYDLAGNLIDSVTLYRNKCHIGYDLPKNIIKNEAIIWKMY